MRLEKTQDSLRKKNISFSYAEEDGCGSLDFEFRGLRYHVWEFNDEDTWGAETNVRCTGKSEDILGDYDSEISALILTWTDMAVSGQRA